MAPWWLQIGHKSEKCNGVIVWWHDVIVKFIWRCRVSLVKFSHWSKFHVNIMTRSGVMTIFNYWPEIRKSEIPLSEICTISGDWDKLGIPNLTQMFLIKSYWMFKMPRLQLLPFLSYQGKITRGWNSPHPY